MRQFFFELLKKLDKLTGIRQFEKLQAMPEAAKETGELLDILCRVCSQFPFIPDKAKQDIILAAVVADQEFIGLNAKIVFKWLQAQRDRFIGTGNQFVEVQPEAPPLTGEARDKRIEEVINAIQKCETNFGKSSNDQLRDYFNKLYKPNGTEQRPKPTSEEEVYARMMHVEYLKANYDARTKEKLPTWMPEEQWLLENGN